MDGTCESPASDVIWQWRRCLLCGLMAKPMVITFPFLLLLWDYWPLQRAQSFAKLALEKVPLLALSAASAVITVKAQRAGNAVGTMVEYPLSMRMENAAISYARYLGKALWPSPLSPQYPYPEGVLKWQAVAAASLLVAITVLICAAGKNAAIWRSDGCWFLGTLVPMIGLVQVGSQAMADRYAYLPFVGLFILICWGSQIWPETRRTPHRLLWPLPVGIALVGIVGGDFPPDRLLE